VHPGHPASGTGAGVRWGWLGVNPAASASPPRVPAADITLPTPDELGRLQISITADDPELAMFVRLSAMTGARRSEMLALRWIDVDLEGGVVTISRGIVMGPDGLVEKDTKTHQARRVALDGDTTRRLAVHQESVIERAGACDTSLADDGFVFSADVEGREPWYRDSVSRRFRSACRPPPMSIAMSATVGTTTRRPSRTVGISFRDAHR
jgi:integrase